MDNTEFLIYSKEILLPLDCNYKDANLRSIISRSYYSLYHSSFLFLRSYFPIILQGIIRDNLNKREFYQYNSTSLKNLDPKYLNSLPINLHRLIPIAFNSVPDRRVQTTLKQVAKEYGEFREKRNEADYNLQNPYDKTEVETILAEIEKTIERIKDAEKRL